MNQLPTGWAPALLGEVAATVLGKMLDSKRNTGANPVPYLRNINVRWGAFDLRGLLTMDIRPDELDRVLARRGDVIACEGGEPGRAAVWPHDEPIAIQKALHLIRPKVGVNPHFLALLLRHQASSGQLDRLFTGTTIKHLPQEKLRLVEVPLPPTREQERIVAAIEEAFSLLDAGEIALHNTRARTKRMRDSVLTAAVTGQLVPQDPLEERPANWGESVKPLFPVPSGWGVFPLAVLLREPMRNGMSAVRSTTPGGLPIFSISAVTTGDFGERNIKRTAGDWDRAAGLWAEPGDLYVQRSNTPELVGTARLYSGAHHVAVFPDLLIRLRPVADCLPQWLELVLAVGPVRQHLRGQAKGLAGSMPKISQPVLARLPIPIPSPEEQARIVAEVERQFSFIEAAERAVDAGLARSKGLRRSVLKTAFEGRLVEQDPADEPASVLLERIAAERAAEALRKRAPGGPRGKVVAS